MIEEMDLLKISIETKRLLLSPLSNDYAENIFMEFTSEITKYMYPKPYENIQKTHDYIEEQLLKLKREIELTLVILKKENNKFIGCLGIYDINTSKPGLWIWIKKSSQNNGYSLESMAELIEWAHKYLKFDYLIYPVSKKNIASRRLPEKNNGIIMAEEKSLGEAGSELDEYEYRIFPKNQEK